MAVRLTRLVPYARLRFWSLVFAVIVTAPFATPRQAGSSSWPVVAIKDSPSSDLTGLKSASSQGPVPDPHELLAKRAAVQMLAEAPAPAGGVSVTTVPIGTPDMSGPPQMDGARQVVDDHRFWIVSGAPEAVLSWFGAHPVSGSVLVGHGSYGTYDVQQLAYDIFDFPAPPGQVLLWRELMIGVARDPAGSVVVRADAQIVWEPTRPLQSFVPGTAVRVVVTDTPPMSPSGTIGSPRNEARQIRPSCITFWPS